MLQDGDLPGNEQCGCSIPASSEDVPLLWQSELLTVTVAEGRDATFRQSLYKSGHHSQEMGASTVRDQTARKVLL